MSLLTDLIAILQADNALAVFAEGNFARPLAVKKGYRRRDEIGLDELPLIRITRPRRVTQKNTIRMGQEHYTTVRLYAGFFTEDIEAAADLAAEFEELLLAAFIDNETTIGTVEEFTAVNDEGMLPPSHFLVIDVTLKTYTLPLTAPRKPFRGEI